MTTKKSLQVIVTNVRPYGIKIPQESDFKQILDLVGIERSFGCYLQVNRVGEFSYVSRVNRLVHDSYGHLCIDLDQLVATKENIKPLRKAHIKKWFNALIGSNTDIDVGNTLLLSSEPGNPPMVSEMRYGSDIKYTGPRFPVSSSVFVVDQTYENICLNILEEMKIPNKTHTYILPRGGFSEG